LHTEKITQNERNELIIMKYRIIEVEKPDPIGLMYEVQRKKENGLKPWRKDEWVKICGDSFFLLYDAKQALETYKNNHDKPEKVVYSE
jgi:hypothetical protein